LLFKVTHRVVLSQDEHRCHAGNKKYCFHVFFVLKFIRQRKADNMTWEIGGTILLL
jgi:hypothetical protein